MSWKNKLYQELIAGRKPFDWIFLALGLIVQVVAYLWQPDSAVAIVSGMAGIVSVILCSQGKISTFFFGFIQITTYLYLCLVQRLYGEVAINVFYFIMQFYGIVVWLRNYRVTDNNSAELKSKKLSVQTLVLLVVAVLLLSLAAGFLLTNYTDDSQPYLDAFTTVPAIAAQILLVCAYREQWLLWLAVDVLSAIMWYRAGNYCLLMQYVFWCVNCLYGYYNWTRKAN